MNKYFIATYLSAFVLLSACSGNTASNQTNAVNSTVANTTAAAPKTTANTDTPETTQGNDEDDYVQSESGTEKVKPAAGKANVQGRVLFNEKPAANIEVRICESFSKFIGGCDGENFKTKTDANGEFLLKNVTPRDYDALLISVFDTKSYIFATKGLGISAAKYKIEADKTFFVKDTNIFKDDLKVQNPLKNAKVDGQNLELKWDAYPDAAYYKVSLSGKGTSIFSFNEKAEGTNILVNKPMPAGEYRLTVTAFNANDVKLSESGDGIEFSAQGGAAATSPANN